jgi:prolyl 4-hydroxylase
VRDEMLFIDGFLSRAECRQLHEALAVVFWEPSLTYQRQRDGVYRNLLLPYRVSETAQQESFSDEANAIMGRIERRLEAIFDFRADHLEPWQLTRYPRHGKFDYHLDAGYWSDHYAGDRILTFILHLDTSLQGGGTHFRALDEYVEARSGRLLVWHNLFPTGECDYRMIHSSVPLLKGKKTTLVTWLRQRPFRIKAHR